MDTSKNIFAYEDLFGWSLSDISRSEKVVIFTSSITDLRMILKYLVGRLKWIWALHITEKDLEIFAG